MKRFLLLCLFLSPRAFGMEAGLPDGTSKVPVPVFDTNGHLCIGHDGKPLYRLVVANGAPMSPFSNGAVPTKPHDNKESLADLLLKLARRAHAREMEWAVVCMEDVEKRVKEENPENLLALLKQRGTYTHVTALAQEGDPSSEHRARLLSKFGALLLKAAGTDREALEGGLHCVQSALASRWLREEEKQRARCIRKQCDELLGNKKKRARNKKKKPPVVGVVAAERDLVAELPLGSPSFPDSQLGLCAADPTTGQQSPLPTGEIAALLAREPEAEKGETVPAAAKPTLPKKKKKKKAKKKREAPLDMSQFTGSWDEIVMELLGRRSKSYEQTVAYLTQSDINFEISDPRLKKALFSQLGGSIATHNSVLDGEQCRKQAGQPDESSTILQQERYILGRLLLENGDANFGQCEKNLPFKLIKEAAESEYTLAQLYLAASGRTGLTKRQRILYLMKAFDGGMSKGARKRALDIADGYIREGYFLPLLARVTREYELGTIDAYLEKLEKNFPSIHLYDIDELIASKLSLKKIPIERWSAKAIRATANSINLLCSIKSADRTDREALLRQMTDEVVTIENQCEDHPELKTLCGSCYSLLGRAYGCCGDIRSALAAHGKAMVEGEDHETTLISYIQRGLSSQGQPSIDVIGSIEKMIRRLVDAAENYKVSAYLFYAAFYSYKNDVFNAECFVQKAERQMDREHDHSERYKQLYNDLKREITEKKMKKTGEARKVKKKLVGMAQDELNKVSCAITDAEAEMKTNPLRAADLLRQVALAVNLFGALDIVEALRIRYDAVIANINQAKDLLTGEHKERLERILQELHGMQQRPDEFRVVDPDNNSVCLIVSPRKGSEQ